MAEPSPNAESRRQSHLFRKAAEHLAYQMWNYEKPNDDAVASVMTLLAKAKEAFQAVGYEVPLNDGTGIPDA